MRCRCYDGGIRRLASPSLAAVAVAAVAALGACSDDAATAGDERAAQARRAAEDAELPEAVGDFLADAAASVDATYRVAYELDDGQGGTRQVVVTQRPPDRRVDIAHADGTVDATISAGGETHQCTRPPDEAEWRCETLGDPPEVAGFDEAAVTQLTESLARAADDYDLEIEERTVAGTRVRCLVTRLRADAAADPELGTQGALCLAASTGAVVLVERPVGTLRAAEYSDDVAPDAFDVPT